MIRWLITLGLLTIFAFQLQAQQPITRDGTELLRGLLNFHGLKPLGEPDLQAMIDREPGRIVLILIDSSTEIGDRWSAQALSKKVLLAGGAVLIATKQVQELGGYFPVTTSARITGFGVNDMNGSLITIKPGQPTEFDRFLALNLGTMPDASWGLFAGSSRISANQPSSIIVRQNSQFIRNSLAQFLPNAYEPVTRTQLPDSRPMAVGGIGSEANPFRSLVMADSSILRNRLMLEARPDGLPLTDNLAFTNRLVLWLRGSGDRQASHCVFVENSQFNTNFDTVKFEAPLPSIPPITPDQLPSPLDRNFQKQLANTLDTKIKEWQDNQGPSRTMVGDMKNDYNYFRIMRGLAVAVVIIIGLLTIRILWKQRHEPGLSEQPKDTGQIGGRAPAGSLNRKCEELLQSGNHTATVRDYLRELFAEAGFPQLPHQHTVNRKDCKISGTAAKTLEGSVRILWDIAYGETPQTVTFSRWKELEPMIESVRAAVAAGTLQLQRAGGAA